MEQRGKKEDRGQNTNYSFKFNFSFSLPKVVEK